MDFLQFENMGVIAVAVGLLIYVISSSILKKSFKDGGVATMISLIFGFIGGGYFYRSDLIFEKNAMSVVLVALAIAVIYFVFIPFVKFFRKR